MRRRRRGSRSLLAGSYVFIALCADSAGAWGDAAQNTLTLCAQRIPVPRRGLVMGLWRQFLSVTFQKERNRVLCHKVVSSLRISSLDVDVGVDDTLSDLYDLLPCFSE